MDPIKCFSRHDLALMSQIFGNFIGILCDFKEQNDSVISLKVICLRERDETYWNVRRYQDKDFSLEIRAGLC